MAFTTVAAVVGTVAGANALFGDPLGLNSGADQANAAATQASQTSSAASGTAAAAQAQLAKIAQDQWDYYKINYQPLETGLIKQATDAGSPGEFARARGAANADVTGAFDTARKSTLNRMQSYGINPGSPAYQSTAASTDIAEGATKAGALTAADNNTRNLAYSKALDVVGLGRNIPAQSAASSANAANAATGMANAATGLAGVANSRANSQFLQNTQNTQAMGYGLNSLSTAAQKWFGTPTTTTTTIAPNYGGGTAADAAAQYEAGNYGGLADGGKVGYADGGAVIDAEKTAPGQYDATGLKTTMMKHGLSESNAHTQAHAAHKRVFTPHMKVFASGGGVGRQGLEGEDMSNMGQDASNAGQLQGPGDETSDSIPAQIDGQEPAALSSGEFVMNAEVPKLTGDEILEAINQAGLQKRQQAGLEPKTSNDVPANAGAQAYADGGEVGADEPKFQSWYAEHAKQRGLNPNPDDPQHFYDYRAAYRAGAAPDASGHWPSEFKRDGHPRMVVDGMNTKTGKPAGMPAYARGGRVSRYTVAGLGA